MTSPRPDQPAATEVPIPDRLLDGILTLLIWVVAVAGVAAAAFGVGVPAALAVPAAFLFQRTRPNQPAPGE